MGNTKKTVEYLNTDDFISLLADRASFSKSDIRVIIDEIKNIFEECIIKGVDIDLKGLIHLTIKSMEYTKTPGIVTYRGKESFNSSVKRVIYKVPVNFKNLLKEENEKNNQ
jgi:nucleoid DNA-binding protein